MNLNHTLVPALLQGDAPYFLLEPHMYLPLRRNAGIGRGLHWPVNYLPALPMTHLFLSELPFLGANDWTYWAETT